MTARLKNYRRNWRQYPWQLWRPEKPPKETATRMAKWRSKLAPIHFIEPQRRENMSEKIRDYFRVKFDGGDHFDDEREVMRGVRRLCALAFVIGAVLGCMAALLLSA